MPSKRAYLRPSRIRTSRQAAGAFGYFDRNAELKCRSLHDAFGSDSGSSATDGGALGFVALRLGAVELMYQTVASVEGDFGAEAVARLGPLPRPTSLFVEVDSLADVEARLAGEPVFQARRTTFYGSRETGYLDPAGNPVLFAQFLPAPG